MKLNRIKAVLEEKGISQLGFPRKWARVLVRSMPMCAIVPNQTLQRFLKLHKYCLWI